MRKNLGIVLAVTVLASAGFAVASIANGGSLAAVLQGTTGTETIGTTSTGQTTTSAQRRVTICHRTGSTKHSAHTITVAQSAVAAHLRHGDHLGPCTGSEPPKQPASKPDSSKAKDAGKPATPKSETPKPETPKPANPQGSDDAQKDDAHVSGGGHENGGHGDNGHGDNGHGGGNGNGHGKGK